MGLSLKDPSRSDLWMRREWQFGGKGMSTSNLVARYERLPLRRLNPGSTDDSPVVSVLQSVNADRDRIFQVLTLPEYIVAGFSAPAAAEGTTEVAMGPDCFLVSYRLLNGRVERFVGSYKILRRSKIYFTWSRNSFEEKFSSLVRIRLKGDFGRTTIHLAHVGLRESEHSHYQSLWEASLQRLAGLFV